MDRQRLDRCQRACLGCALRSIAKASTITRRTSSFGCPTLLVVGGNFQEFSEGATTSQSKRKRAGKRRKQGVALSLVHGTELATRLEPPSEQWQFFSQVRNTRRRQSVFPYLDSLSLQRRNDGTETAGTYITHVGHSEIQAHAGLPGCELRQGGVPHVGRDAAHGVPYQVRAVALEFKHDAVRLMVG